MFAYKEQEFLFLRGKIAEQITQFAQSADNKILQSEIENNIKEASDLILTLELDTLQLGVTYKQKIRKFKNDLEIQRNQFSKIALLSPRTTSTTNSTNAHERLEESKKTLEKSSEKIRIAIQRSIEMQQIGADTMCTLEGQTAQLKGISKKLGDIDMHLNSSNKNIKQMDRRILF